MGKYSYNLGGFTYSFGCARL